MIDKLRLSPSIVKAEREETQQAFSRIDYRTKEESKLLNLQPSAINHSTLDPKRS